jgi:hypothetical protein
MLKNMKTQIIFIQQREELLGLIASLEATLDEELAAHKVGWMFTNHDSAVDRNDYEAVLRIRIRELGSGIRCLFDPWIREKKEKRDVSKYVRKFITIFLP